MSHNVCGRLDSPSSIAQIQSWLASCSASHERCRFRRRLAERLPSRNLPTRFLDIKSQGPGMFAVGTLTTIVADNAVYVAVSHRWTGDVPQLRQANAGQLQTGQQDTTLPSHYQDITAGFQYVMSGSTLNVSFRIRRETFEKRQAL